MQHRKEKADHRSFFGNGIPKPTVTSIMELQNAPFTVLQKPLGGNIRMSTALWGKQGRAWAQGASSACVNGKGGTSLHNQVRVPMSSHILKMKGEGGTARLKSFSVVVFTGVSERGKR